VNQNGSPADVVITGVILDGHGEHWRRRMQLRTMRREDIPAGLRLCRSASWNQLAEDWELLLAASPDGCRVATNEDGEVVGSIAALNYGSAFTWIAMVLVDPGYRRAGIGTRLLMASLEIVGDDTARLDATPAGQRVYVPLGFQEEYPLQRMTRRREGSRDLPPVPARESDSISALPLHVRPMTDSDFVEVLRQDRDVFGGARRLLLDTLRARAPEYAWVIGDDEIEGYLFGRQGHSFEHLGPLVARDEQSARALVSTCLASYADRSFLIDVPLQASWVDWLASLGFVVQRPFTRMRRGTRPFHERLDRIFAITGPEFG
jgi:predicted N-acetyltransferase YhbS